MIQIDPIERHPYDRGVHVHDIPLDPRGHLPFDPRDIANHLPGGGMPPDPREILKQLPGGLPDHAQILKKLQRLF